MVNEHDISVFADFNNTDAQGRVRLNCVGTIQDLNRLGIVLYDGKEVILDDRDGLRTPGIVRFIGENGWVAEIDWKSFDDL